MKLNTKTLSQRTEDRGRRTDVCYPSSAFRLQSSVIRPPAFTLIELVVAIALLAMVIFFAGSVFKAAIGSYRIATAQAEVMQKLRAITGQLNSDFKGLRKDAPLFIWFQLDPNDFNRRLDQIMFFADGDLQSTQTYDTDPNPDHYQIPLPTCSPIVSNVARIQYGQAEVVSPVPIYGGTYRPWEVDETDLDRFHHLNHGILARCQHLLTADPNIFPWIDYSNFAGTFTSTGNGRFEHDPLSLSQWQALTTIPANNDWIITVCLGLNNRPQINFKNNNGLHKLMTEGVGNMSIQWAYSPNLLLKPPGTIFWWPSIDPDGDGLIVDSDFGSMTFTFFCVCFNVAQPSVGFLPLDAKGEYVTDLHFPGTFYPTALKFTFTLYDSKGVFKDGQTFTHIVYLGD